MTTRRRPTSPPDDGTAHLVLRDGRVMAFSDLGDPGGVPVLSCLGTPHSRIPHPDDHEVWMWGGSAGPFRRP